MGQGSSSSNSALQIVDEEALSLTRKSKGKETGRRMVKRTLMYKTSSVLSTTSRDTFPPSSQTERRRTIQRWKVLQRCKSSAKASTEIFFDRLHGKHHRL